MALYELLMKDDRIVKILYFIVVSGVVKTRLQAVPIVRQFVHCPHAIPQT